jgi:hypothetical protein
MSGRETEQIPFDTRIAKIVISRRIRKRIGCQESSFCVIIFFILVYWMKRQTTVTVDPFLWDTKVWSFFSWSAFTLNMNERRKERQVVYQRILHSVASRTCLSSSESLSRFIQTQEWRRKSGRRRRDTRLLSSTQRPHSILISAPYLSFQDLFVIEISLLSCRVESLEHETWCPSFPPREKHRVSRHFSLSSFSSRQDRSN